MPSPLRCAQARRAASASSISRISKASRISSGVNVRAKVPFRRTVTTYPSFSSRVNASLMGVWLTPSSVTSRPYWSRSPGRILPERIRSLILTYAFSPRVG